MSVNEKVTPKSVCDTGFVRISLHNQPTVLVVDDEALIREITTIMVEENGGRALTANDGPAALDIFRQNRDSVNVVFLDFSMPRMNGYETLVELRKLVPTLPIVIVSGLKMTPEVDALHREGKVEFLSKPFHETELVKALNNVLQTL